jgi:uncharacterized protein (TIGR00251 family)
VYSIKDDYLILPVIIKTNAKQNSIMNIFDGKLKIALNAKPVQGKANQTLIKFLAKMLNIPQSAVEIIRGDTNSVKMIKLPLSIRDELDSLVLLYQVQ